MNKMLDINLKEKADSIRADILSVAVPNGAGHIAPSLSCVDILVALYYQVMNYDPSDPCWDQRDRLLLAKAHGCYGLYAILAEKGLIPADAWREFYKGDSPLAGCAEREMRFGIEAGCGSLGHGLPMAVGVAFGAKLQRATYHTYCVVGDGEMQEGTNWEAIQFAVKYELDNLTIIIDTNGLQAMDRLVNILDRHDDDLLKRLEGFALAPVVCDGHNAPKLAQLAARLKGQHDGTPHVIVAKTVKGYGLQCMENVAKFHFRLPTEAELQLGASHG